MVWKRLIPVLILHFLVLNLQQVEIQCDNLDDNWIEPNAWAREGPSYNELDEDKELRKCNAIDGVCTASEDSTAMIYYKKLIAVMFNRQKLRYDDVEALYKRSLHFTLLPTELEQLEQLSDPRDLDYILTNILTKASSRAPIGTCSSGAEDEGRSNAALFLEILKDSAQLLQTSELRFLLIMVSAILLGWFVHRRYGIGIVTMILVVFVAIGYIHTYLECNRKLEVEEMLEALEQSEAATTKEIPRWYSPLANIFGSSDTAATRRSEHIRKSSKINLAFCRPDHVLIMYGNDLFLKQLELLLEKCTSTIITMKANLSFPYNVLAAFMLIAMIGYMLKLTFKYILSPRAWASLLHRPHAGAQSAQEQATAISGAATPLEDRLSGENLRLLLNAVGGQSTLIVQSSTSAAALPVSGVQEVPELLEGEQSSSSAGSAKSTPNTSQIARQLEVSPINSDDNCGMEPSNNGTLISS